MVNQLTKQSSESEIKAYFIQILNLAQSKEEFPVNLDDVWPLVFKFRADAVRALAKNNLFVKGIDYQVFSKNAENPEVLFQSEINRENNNQDGGNNGKVKQGINLGGRPQNTYMLSVPCLEFFIARKVRPVFEVYRQVFHKVANGSISLGNQQFQSKPMSLEETLAPLARYHAMIEDRISLLLGALANAPHEIVVSDAEKCRLYYQFYRKFVSNLVYYETAVKLEGVAAFSLYDR